MWFDGKPIANFTIERHRIIFDDGEIEFETQTEIRTGSLRTGIFKSAGTEAFYSLLISLTVGAEMVKYVEVKIKNRYGC